MGTIINYAKTLDTLLSVVKYILILSIITVFVIFLIVLLAGKEFLDKIALPLGYSTIELVAPQAGAAITGSIALLIIISSLFFGLYAVFKLKEVLFYILSGQPFAYQTLGCLKSLRICYIVSVVVDFVAGGFYSLFLSVVLVEGYISDSKVISSSHFEFTYLLLALTPVIFFILLEKVWEYGMFLEQRAAAATPPPRFQQVPRGANQYTEGESY